MENMLGINPIDCPDCECEEESCNFQIGIVGSLTPAPEKAILGRRNGGSGQILPIEIDHADPERKAIIHGEIPVDNQYRDDIITGVVALAGCVDDVPTVLSADCQTRTDGECTASTFAGVEGFGGYQVTGINFSCYYSCGLSGGIFFPNTFNKAHVCADGKIKPGITATTPFVGSILFLVYYFGGEGIQPNCGVLEESIGSPIILLELSTGETIYGWGRPIGGAAEASNIGSFTGKFAFAEAMGDSGEVVTGGFINPCAWTIAPQAHDLQVSVLTGGDAGTAQTWKDGYGGVETGKIVLGAIYSGGVLIINQGCTLPRGTE